MCFSVASASELVVMMWSCYTMLIRSPLLILAVATSGIYRSPWPGLRHLPGYEVLHMKEDELPFDHAKPVLVQRSTRMLSRRTQSRSWLGCRCGHGVSMNGSLVDK